jgi:hypothetical protein
MARILLFTSPNPKWVETRHAGNWTSRRTGYNAVGRIWFREANSAFAEACVFHV